MNRTCNIVVHFDGRDELKKGAHGVPVVGGLEITFAGHALAAKWLLEKKNWRKLRGAREVYLRCWGEGGMKIDEIKCLHSFYCGKDKALMKWSEDECREKWEALANDKEENEKDAEYLKEYL